MAEYKEMVARACPDEEGERCLEFWEKAEGEITGFLSDLVQRYNPAQPVGEGLGAVRRRSGAPLRGVAVGMPWSPGRRGFLHHAGRKTMAGG